MGEVSEKIKTDREIYACQNRILKYLHKPILHILLIAAVGLIAYLNTFDVPLTYDDKYAIAENPVVKDFSYLREPSKVKGLIIHGHDGQVVYKAVKARYVGFVTLALNYSVHGLDVRGYHIVNLAIHIINALLVYYLIVLTFRTPALRNSLLRERSSFIALLSALLFISHPIQTEAVTYIVQRLTSLATLFYLLSFIMFIKARSPEAERNTKTAKRNNKIKPILYYVISMASAVLAMKTKEIAFTLPVIITIYDFIFLESRMKKKMLFLIPLLLTMLIIPLSLIDFEKPIGKVIADISDEVQIRKDVSRSDYFLTQIRVIVTYIRLLLLPINQNLEYEYPIYHSLFDPEVFLSLIFLMSIFGLGVYVMYRYRNAIPHTRLISFGIFWFFVTQVVESSVILHVIFEHRMYLPSIGMFIVTSLFIMILMNRLVGRQQVIMVSFCAVLIVTLSVATFLRNSIWQNNVTLWEDVVMKNPSYYLPHFNLGTAYAEQNRLDEAITEFKAALMFRPDYADAYYNLGIAYGNQNRLDEAISAYKAALMFRPDYADAYYNLGIAYGNQNRLDEAISVFKAALQYRPDDADTYNNIGSAYAKLNLFDEAISAYKTALQLRPDHADALRNLKLCYEIIKTMK